MISYIILILLVVNIAIVVFKKPPKNDEILRNEFEVMRREYAHFAMQSREELSRTIGDFNKQISEKMTQLTNLQVVQLGEVAKNNQDSIKLLTGTVEERLKQMQEQNQIKLDNIRKTVDENLNKTLQERISASFKTVSERLELVHKGLGEMQALAQSVGDLKKTLSNVKTRGIFGEIQLGALLEQILSPVQYDVDIAIEGRERVEFAIKIPQIDDEFLYLPIDSKFPLDVYTHLVDAYDNANQSEVISCGKELEAAIKKSAKDIRTKYIVPNKTVDFAIMFLPIEGLYAEVARRDALLTQLQQDRVLVAGPTTLTALISSLQVGFKTVAIEKRSSEVWKILGNVKKEFNTFAGILENAQKRINLANDDIEKLVTTRTRMIMSKLKAVEEIDYDAKITDASDDENIAKVSEASDE